MYKSSLRFCKPASIESSKIVRVESYRAAKSSPKKYYISTVGAATAEGACSRYERSDGFILGAVLGPISSRLHCKYLYVVRSCLSMDR